MGILSLTKMAWRNLWRNRRRTLITALMISFSTMLAVLMSGLQDDSWSKVIEVAARIGGGHVTIQHPAYLDKPALTRTISGTEKKKELASADPNVKKAMTRIVGQTLLATAHGSYGAAFIAFDPAAETVETLSILDAIAEPGKPFTDPKQKGILVGYRLAKNLGVELGKKVVYTMTDKHGEIVTGLARVTGIIKSGSPTIDLYTCLLPIDIVRETLGYQADEAVQIALFVDDHRRAGVVSERIGGQLDGEVAALTWKQMQPDLDSMIAMKKGGTIFFELVMLIMCTAGIFITLFVSVMERLRELGILMAVGFAPIKLFLLVIIESMWLAVVGLIGGVALAAWPYHYLSTVGIDMSQMYQGETVEIAGIGMSTIMKVGIYPENAVAIAVAVFIGTMLSALYPAWRATRIEPVETIKLV